MESSLNALNHDLLRTPLRFRKVHHWKCPKQNGATQNYFEKSNVEQQWVQQCKDHSDYLSIEETREYIYRPKASWRACKRYYERELE